MMEFTAEMIAGFLGGQVAGDKEAKVHTVSSIEEGEPGALTYLTNPKYEKHLYKTRASIVLVNKDFTPSEPVTATLIKVEDTGAAVLKLLQMYQAAKPRKQGISERASISERATLGEDCYVGDFAVIEAGARIGADCQIYPQVYIGDGVTVGDGTILYPGVKIYEGCVIGSRCILHAGAGDRRPTASASFPMPQAASTRFRNWATSSSKTTWKSAPTPASTGPRPTRRSSAGA